ncbi:MAG: glucoamylase, partial [Microbacterium sp. 14-71-5]
METPPIEDYALLSDGRTAALVSRTGSIDWFCAPRLDSASLFGALLGGVEQGHWSLRPTDSEATATRHYDGDTFCLVTRWKGADGVAEVREWMPVLLPQDRGTLEGARAALGADRTDLIRRVVGISGRMSFAQELRLRFDYARALPWVRQTGSPESPELTATAGPDAVVVRGAELRPHGHSHVGAVEVAAGESAELTLTWFPSYRPAPAALDGEASERATASWWTDWADGIAHEGPHEDDVRRSLLLL